jgi:hypothetical protein
MGSFNSEARPCVCCVLNSEACVLEENCLLKNIWKIIFYSVCTGTGLCRSVGWDNEGSIVTCYDHSLPSSTEVKGRVDLHSSHGPSWPVVG